MRNLHENQRKIMECLLDRPEGATLDELASHLGITKTAAKEHLNKVQSLGYITHQDSRGRIGRPRRRYMLSPEGHEVFPRQYSWLSNVLLAHLADDFGEKVVTQIMESLAQKVSDSMKERFAKANSPAELLTAINAALNELGYRSTIKQSDFRKGAVLEATNCVYHSVAKTHPELCRFDVEFIKNASGGMQVKLEKCITRGDSVCRFCLRK